MHGLRQPPAEQRADQRAGQDGGDVDERPGHRRGQCQAHAPRRRAPRLLGLDRGLRAADAELAARWSAPVRASRSSPPRRSARCARSRSPTSSGPAPPAAAARGAGWRARPARGAVLDDDGRAAVAAAGAIRFDAAASATGPGVTALAAAARAPAAAPRRCSSPRRPVRSTRPAPAAGARSWCRSPSSRRAHPGGPARPRRGGRVPTRPTRARRAWTA